jgi:hypothetical protein
MISFMHEMGFENKKRNLQNYKRNDLKVVVRVRTASIISIQVN